MLKIRLQRVGRTHEPSFRLVLTESENSTKSGRFTEILGSYDPRGDREALKVDKIKHWLSMGAKTTPTVHNLLVSKKVIDSAKINVLPNGKGGAPVALAPEPVVETPVVEEVVQEDAKIEEVPEEEKTA